MLTCKEVARLVSESLDRRLPLPQRLALWMHLLLCGMCRVYRTQILILRKMIRRGVRSVSEKNAMPGLNMPVDSRVRMKRALRGSGQDLSI